MQEQLSLRKALTWILLSTFVVSGGAFLSLKWLSNRQQNRLLDNKYIIERIIQTTPSKERLNSFYLAELLKLSVDKSTNLHRFSNDVFLQRLLDSPIIESAKVQKIEPSTIYVDYTLRTPVAYLCDYSNTLIDKEGVPFPFKPFFTPKNLPEIYLGLENNLFKWGKKINTNQALLGLYLLEFIQHNCCNEDYTLKKIDVSNVLSDSYGQRQIIVYFENKDFTKGKTITRQEILRLSVNNYRKELANYLVLRKWLENKSTNSDNDSIKSQLIIDLRIPELAFITQN